MRRGCSGRDLTQRRVNDRSFYPISIEFLGEFDKNVFER